MTLDLNQAFSTGGLSGQTYPLTGSYGQPVSLQPATNPATLSTFDINSGIKSGGLSMGGQVLGDQTTATPNYNPTDKQQPSNSGGYTPGQGKYAGWDPAAEAADRAAKGDYTDYSNSGGGGFDALKSDISSGWDNYINSLNAQLGDLDTQRMGQQGIAESMYRQGANTLGTQREQGLTNLSTEERKLQENQSKTLRDISGSLKSGFMAGNVYLGSRGAGDSSASNQYSLALAKEGSRQRGDVMGQTASQLADVQARRTQLDSIYNTEVRNLDETKNQRLLEIGQWFSQAQQQIRQAQAQGQLGKSQDLQSLSRDILNQAISQMNMINQQVAERKSALDSWAMSNAKNIEQLAGNMRQVSQFTSQLPGFTQIAGTPQVDSSGNFRVATGYGSRATNNDRLQGIA
jgi:hypothetical protein